MHNSSISSYLSTSPRLTGLLILLTVAFLIKQPLQRIFSTAHALSRVFMDVPIDILAGRAFSFAVLTVVILLEGALLAILKIGLDASWLEPYGVGGPTGQARALITLGGVGWLFAALLQVVDSAGAEFYGGKSALVFTAGSTDGLSNSCQVQLRYFSSGVPHSADQSPSLHPPCVAGRHS